jgi:hypothetical protein
VNVTEYRQAQEAVARETEEKVTALYGVFSSDDKPLTSEEFARLAGAVVSMGNRRAALLADTFQSSELDRSPLGVSRADDEARALGDAIRLLIEDGDDPLPRLSRLARSEPVQASRQAAREVLQRNGVKQYVWKLSNDDACGLCKFLARRKWPVSKVPVSHPSCTCQVVPVREVESNERKQFRQRVRDAFRSRIGRR